MGALSFASGFTDPFGIVGTLTGKDAEDAANRAAALQQAATDRATAEQARQFDLSRSDQMPWLTGGKSALSELLMAYGLPTQNADGTTQDNSGYDAMEKVRATPGYQLRLDEGLQGVDRSASARGNLLSGANLKALNQYGQDYATNEFGNYTNRLSNLAGIGQTSAQNLGSLGANYASNLGNLWTNNANAQGAAGMVGPNARASTLNSLIGAGGAYLGGR